MNGTGDSIKPESNKNVILIVVIGLVVNGTIGVASLAYCLILGRELNGVLLTAFVGLINYIFGAVSGMLMKTSPSNATSTEPKPEPSKPAGEIEVPAQKLETTIT